MKIHIITDSASDIETNEYDSVSVVPMKINFAGKEYLDGVTISNTRFYEMLIEDNILPTTSQLTPFDFEEAIKAVVGNGDIALVITLSSRLSGTYASACSAASAFSENVYVVDSENVTIGEHALVEYAYRLASEGMPIDELVETLNKEKKNIRLIALLDTLEYLQKGGRVSKAVATAAGLLNIKPVIEIRNGEVNILGKARGSRQGNSHLAQQISANGIDFSKPFFLGYTGISDRLLLKYIEDNRALWQDHNESLTYRTVGATIGTHAGPDAIAAAFFALNQNI